MAQYTFHPDSTFDSDRPILGSTHLAIARNFEALAEGAAGAPRVQGVALNTFVSFTSGATEILNLDEKAILFASISTTGSNERLQVSNDGGSNWISFGLSFSDGNCIYIFNLFTGEFVQTGIGDTVFAFGGIAQNGTVSGAPFNSARTITSASRGALLYIGRGDEL